jgi:hypothetical protein
MNIIKILLETSKVDHLISEQMIPVDSKTIGFAAYRPGVAPT